MAGHADEFNAAHPDTVAFVVRYLTMRPEIAAAEITRIDGDGVTFSVRVDGGEAQPSRIDFDAPCTSVRAVTEQLYGLVPRARSLAQGTVPLTSIEQEMAAISQLSTYSTTVVAVEDLTPRLRQITVGGGLDSYPSIGGDQFLLASPLDADGNPTDAGRAYYTVRRWRPDVGEIDLWFVLHEDPGPLSGWAAQASPGARLSLWGPRTSFEAPADTTSLLLVADDTGIPAVAAILDERAAAMRIDVVVETYDEDHRVPLPEGPEVTIRWLYRRGEEPGTGTRLRDAVRELDLRTDGLYAFGAGESRQMTAVRRHLRSDEGLAAGQVRMVAYWRRAKAS